MSGPKTPASPSPKKPTHKQPKVFDIRRPGKAIASPTSRPVVVPPKVKDSVLVEKPQTSPKPSRIAGDPYEKHELMDSTKKVMIQPPASVVTPKQTSDAPAAPTQLSEPAPQPPKPSELPKDQTTTEALLQSPGPAATTELAPPPASQPLTPSISDDVPAPAGPLEAHELASEPSHPTESQTHEELLASTAPPEVDMSRAVISTHVSPRRHLWRGVFIAIGLLLFVAAAFDILLDAKILHISGVPHTNLFTSGN